MREVALQISHHTVAAIASERAYILPHPLLRSRISHYTLYVPKQAIRPTQITVIPDASCCIVCNFNQEVLKTTFWGPSSKAVVVQNNASAFSFYIMVEFLPGGAHDVLNIPMNLLHNTREALEVIAPDLARLITDSFEHYIQNKSPAQIDGFLVSLDALFLHRLGEIQKPRLPHYLLSQMQRYHGALRIGDLARQTGYSERHLNRILSAHLGINAKRMSRIVRINAACNAMTISANSLTELSHHLHYHDQSHFTHDFLAVCGVTPGDYLQNMSDFYNEELKFGVTIPSK